MVGTFVHKSLTLGEKETWGKSWKTFSGTERGINGSGAGFLEKGFMGEEEKGKKVDICEPQAYGRQYGLLLLRNLTLVLALFSYEGGSGGG